MEVYKLDDWDKRAIKEYVQLNPKAKIVNRGVDGMSPEFSMHSKTVYFEASINCRDDVFNEVSALVANSRAI